ncbi:MAG: hypothetical protein KDD60_08170, partial [Bdellovibrionales bacterium]|nr:hypothetical protein [Bdellovibrionales bacterium]
MFRRVLAFILPLFVVLVAVFGMAAVGSEVLSGRKVAVRFWKVPIVGGISQSLFSPGNRVYHYPFVSELYEMEVGIHDFSFSTRPNSADGPLQTRALDGNEVTLEVTVTYEIS